MPNPKPNEQKDEFIKRCMGDDKALNDFPDNAQRYAVCQSLWEKDKMSALSLYKKAMKLESYTDYPKQASENAKIALRWAEEHGWGDCLEATGKARANQLANGEPISEDTISRMASFERHRQHSKKELGDGCGRLAWLAWGGDAGIEWAQRKLEQIRK